MTYDQARFRVILYSLILTGVLLPFFFLAPVFHFPLSSEQSQQSVSLILPVFLGYLGAGASYVFNQRREALPEQSVYDLRLLGLMINGIFVVFTLCFCALLFSFYMANRDTGLPGTGMDFPTFSNYLTAILSILTTVVGASVIYLFGVQPKEK